MELQQQKHNNIQKQLIGSQFKSPIQSAQQKALNSQTISAADIAQKNTQLAPQENPPSFFLKSDQMQYDNVNKNKILSPLNAADRYNKSTNKTTIRPDHKAGNRVVNDTTSATEHDERQLASQPIQKMYFAKTNQEPNGNHFRPKKASHSQLRSIQQNINLQNESEDNRLFIVNEFYCSAQSKNIPIIQQKNELFSKQGNSTYPDRKRQITLGNTQNHPLTNQASSLAASYNRTREIKSLLQSQTPKSRNSQDNHAPAREQNTSNAAPPNNNQPNANNQYQVSFRSRRSFLNSKTNNEKNESNNSNQNMKLQLANGGNMEGLLQKDCDHIITEQDLFARKEASHIKHISLKPRQNESRSTNTRKKSKFEEDFSGYGHLGSAKPAEPFKDASTILPKNEKLFGQSGQDKPDSKGSHPAKLNGENNLKRQISEQQTINFALGSGKQSQTNSGGKGNTPAPASIKFKASMPEDDVYQMNTLMKKNGQGGQKQQTGDGPIDRAEASREEGSPSKGMRMQNGNSSIQQNRQVSEKSLRQAQNQKQVMRTNSNTDQQGYKLQFHNRHQEHKNFITNTADQGGHQSSSNRLNYPFYKDAASQNQSNESGNPKGRKSKNFFKFDEDDNTNKASITSTTQPQETLLVKDSRRHLHHVPPKSLGHSGHINQILQGNDESVIQQQISQQKKLKNTNSNSGTQNGLLALNNQLSNFIGSEQVKGIMQKNEQEALRQKRKNQSQITNKLDASVSPLKPKPNNNLAKILLTPWAEQKIMDRLEANASQIQKQKDYAIHCQNRFNQMSKVPQMSQVSQSGLNFVMANPAAQAQQSSYYPMDEDAKMVQFKNMLLNVIKGQNIQNVLSHAEAHQFQQIQSYINHKNYNKGFQPIGSSFNQGLNYQQQQVAMQLMPMHSGPSDRQNHYSAGYKFTMNGSCRDVKALNGQFNNGGSGGKSSDQRFNETNLNFLKDSNNKHHTHEAQHSQSSDYKTQLLPPTQSNQNDFKNYIDQTYSVNKSKELLKEKSGDILIPSNSATFDTNERDNLNFSHDVVSHENSRQKIERANNNNTTTASNSEQGNHFYMSLNYNKGQMQFIADNGDIRLKNPLVLNSATIKQFESKSPQSPSNHEDSNLPVSSAMQNRKQLSNRHKVLKQSSIKNQIDVQDQNGTGNKSPYDGLFNVDVKPIRKGDQTQDDNTLVNQQYSAEQTGSNEGELIDNMLINNPSLYKSNNYGQIAPLGGSAVQSEQTKQQQASASGAVPDFNIEYAQLIAHQFPIYDDGGGVIDYSQINEFQLELLALHEEYGETKDNLAKQKIFQKLSTMNEEEFYRQRRMFNPQGIKIHGRDYVSATNSKDNGEPALRGVRAKIDTNINQKQREESNNKKTVMQLEKERMDRERQELIIKRKRNSNYIQQCIQHGKEHYSEQRLNQLNWGQRQRQVDHKQLINYTVNQIDDRNLEILKKKQEILAKYNKMSKENHPNLADDGYYRYTMTKGNNSQMIKRVLLTRDYWQELEQQHLTLYSFKWAQVSRFINFEQLGLHGQKKLVNHIECHHLLTTKDQLYLNMYRYCELNKLNVFQYMPVQFVLDLSAKNFINEVDRFCQYFNILEKIRVKQLALPEPDYAAQLQQINQKIEQNKQIQQVQQKYKNQISRKFTIGTEMYKGGNVWLIKPNDFNRGRGVSLFNSLAQLRKLMKEFSLGNEMDFYMHNACCQILANERAMVNHLPEKKEKEDTEELDREFSPSKIKNNNGEQNNANDQDENGKNINLKANVKSEVFVVQKYLERPLLIDSRKFDIRLWVMVNCVDLKDQRCYLFQEGYIRTSSYKFTLNQQSIDQPMVHLTNNAVQQYDQNYGKLEEGNQLSFTQASEIIEEQQGRHVDFYKILNEKILPVVQLTLKCVDSNRLNPQAKRHQFEIFGYDFMIDEELTPWLIEVNTNPCLEETSALLRTLLPRMIDDAFKLTLDVCFPRPKDKEGNSSSGSEDTKATDGIQFGSIGAINLGYEQKAQQKQRFPVEGYKDDDNMWRHIHTLKAQ